MYRYIKGGGGIYSILIKLLLKILKLYKFDKLLDKIYMSIKGVGYIIVYNNIIHL